MNTPLTFLLVLLPCSFLLIANIRVDYLHPQEAEYKKALQKYHSATVIVIADERWRIPQLLPHLIKFESKILISISSDMDFDLISSEDYPDGVILFFPSQYRENRELTIDDVLITTGLHSTEFIWQIFTYDTILLE